MGRFIVRFECPEERFLLWSTIVDAPVTYGMSEEELREYIKVEYGNEGLRQLDARLKRCREKGTSAYRGDLESLLVANRAGPNETEATLEEIKEKYAYPPEDP